MRASTLLACLLAMAGAHAQTHEYPTRPIRLLVPFPPGGGADTLARIIAPRLAEAMGQQWVIDNRSGASGNIAVQILARAAPDGHTVLLTLNSVLTMNPLLYRKLGFDVERDLQPLSQISSGLYVLALNPAVPAASVKELIVLAKRKPGSLAFASAGIGSPPHLAAELLKVRAGIDLTHVPYKGAGPSVVATIAGEVQMNFGSVASTMTHARAGRLRAIAVSGTTRSKAMPELPTLAETGFPGFDVRSWHAVLVPAGTPPAIVERLHKEVLAAAHSTPVQEAMSRQGMETRTGKPEELAQLIRTETATWREAILAAKIQPE